MAPPPPPTPRGRPSSSQAENHTRADRLQNISAALSVPTSVKPCQPRSPPAAPRRNLAHGQYKIDTAAAPTPRGDDHAPTLRTATSAPGSEERPRRARDRTREGARGRGGRHPGPLAPPTPPSPHGELQCPNGRLNGQVYFANIITGETRWAPPIGWRDGWVSLTSPFDRRSPYARSLIPLSLARMHVEGGASYLGSL